MDNNEMNFINLVSSFLNSSNPSGTSFDWKKIYDIAYINNVVGIIGNEIKKLPLEQQPDGEIKKLFKRHIAASIFKYDTKVELQQKLKAIFTENNIDYLLVKGAAIACYYPVPELRTSGDIDVIVREEQFEKVYDVINDLECENITYLPFVIECEIDGVTVEIHKGADVFGNYFDDIFALADNNGCEYCLDNYHQMLYVFLHLTKHLRSNGAGIRMLMDIDVCIREIKDFDAEKFLNMCKVAGAEQCGKVLLSICKYWFNTPISSYFTLEEIIEVSDLFVKGFLYGGTFGFENKGYGAMYLAGASKNGNIGKKEKICAFINWLFPPVRILKMTFDYVNKYPILIPFAYVHRFFVGLIRHNSNTKNTLKEIKNSNPSAVISSKIMDELNIK